MTIPKDHEWQVSNKELSKRLKELKVKQESLWWWKRFSGKRYQLRLYNDLISPLMYPKDNYSAFTVAESGEMLPTNIKKMYLSSHKYYYSKERKTEWIVGYKNIANEMVFSFQDITEANARAKTLIYLLENKLIKRNV